jgi:hypothetical protein
MNLVRNRRAPKRAKRFIWANAGSPTSGDAYGDGTLIVIAPRNKEVSRAMKEQPTKVGQSTPLIQACREGIKKFTHVEACENANH